jgi:hypothetical protein
VAYLEKLNREQRRAVEHGVRERDCAPLGERGRRKVNALIWRPHSDV